MNNKEELAKKYKLNPTKNIAICSKTLKVVNFDWTDILISRSKTLPEYISSLGIEWKYFINYDLITDLSIRSNFKARHIQEKENRELTEKLEVIRQLL